jgi:DNA-binding SARP family transcriptional activator
VDYRILGPLEVRVGGRPVDLGTPKQRGLLALLLLHANASVSTDRLADLLWDGAPPARAEVSLRSYAANLRKLLQPDAALAGEPGAYRLTVDEAAIDANRFESLVASARASAAAGDASAALAAYGEALSLWRGPALADVSSLPFAAAEARRLEEHRLAAMEEGIALRVAGGAASAAAALPELEREVRSHPLREDLRASLLRALHAAGRTGEALASYRELQERLADELGLDPSPALQALEAVLRDTSPERNPRPEPEPATTPTRGRAAFVGRARELTILESALAAAKDGRGRVVVLEGDAGIGKSRLAEELVERARSAGCATAWAGCLATGDAPAFWPWAEVLRAIDIQVPLAPRLDARTADVLALVPDLGPDAAPARTSAIAPDAARYQRYDAVTALLTAASTARPLVVVLDDVQWADAPSLRLLAFLAGHLATAAVLVVVTLRRDEADRDDVRELLADLARQPGATRLGLSGLDAGEVAALVRAASGDAVEPGVLDVIVDRSGGNPFFVTELLRLDPDRLRAEGVPAAVRDVVRQRLQRLPDDATRVLQVAAVIGRTFDAGVLEAVAGAGVDDALDQAAAVHLVEEDEVVGRYRFPHALVQETLTEGLSGLRRARLHAAIATAIESAGGRGDDDVRLGELARHLCAGAVTSPAVAARAAAVSLEVGDRAVERLGYETGADLYQRAIDAIAEGAIVTEADHARLLVALAAARRASGDPAASREACLAAAALAQKVGDAELVAAAAVGLALPGSVVGMDFGQLDEERIALLETALDLLPPDDSPTRARVLAHLALALYLSPQLERRRAAAEEAVAVASRLGSPGLQAAALSARRSTQWGRSDPAERLATTREIIALAEAGGADQTALEGHIALAIDALETADLGTFLAEVRLVDGRAEALRQPFYAWYARVLEAAHASLEARFADAAVLAEAAREVGGVALGRRALWGQIGWRFVTGLDTGGLAELEPSLLALHSAFPDNVLVRAALGLLLAGAGRPDEARAIAGPLLASPSAVPEDATWTFGLTLLAEIAWLLDDGIAGGAIADLLAVADGRLVLAGSGVACCGASDRARGLGLLTAGRLDEAEPVLEAAVALNRRIGAPAWAARAEAALAALRLQRSPGDAAAAALREGASRTAAELGAEGLVATIARFGAGR